MKYYVYFEGNRNRKKEFGGHWSDKYWIIGFVGKGKSRVERYIIGYQGLKDAENAAYARCKDMNNGK